MGAWLLAWALSGLAAADGPTPVRAWAGSLGSATSSSVSLYRWFHAHPELSRHEAQTAERLATELEALGMEVHRGIGGHGIVGVLGGRRPGPVVLYRADMDALPVLERTGVPYASEQEGVMHACGHDVHMATAVGALRVLADHADAWRGTIVFVGQPAEELGLGAADMLADRKFKAILHRVGQPVLAVALHDAADLPAGDVSLLAGYGNANVDSIDIVVHGKGGHGARPEETIDPIVIGSEIVMSLQTIVSRRLGPSVKAVITVGKFAAGTKHNIIPPEATLLLTVRSYTDETRQVLLREIRRTAVQIARAHNAPRDPTIQVDPTYTPAAYNDPAWTERLRVRFGQELGEAHVHTHPPSMGGEDFGRYARQLEIPGVMWKLGAVSRTRYARTGGRGLPGLHSDQWAPDPMPTVRTGIETVVAAILEVLGEPAPTPVVAPQRR